MDYSLSLVLGVIQGLTEFLPVSSSGHLVLFQHLFGLKEPELLFDIWLHAGTLAAVGVVFFNEIQKIVSALVRLPALIKEAGGVKPLFAENEEIRIVVFILIGSIPTAVLGLFIESKADRIFGTPWVSGLMLLVTGTFLWFTKKITRKERSIKQLTIKDALIIGFVQGVAVLPGISRSGATISAALFLGMERGSAGSFSFLLSIPAILGALLLSLNSPLTQGSVSEKMIFLGAFTAAVVGFFALKALLRAVKGGRLHYFAPYCWAVGAIALAIMAF